MNMMSLNTDQATAEANAPLTAAVLENDRFAREGIIAELEIDNILVVGSANDAAGITRLVDDKHPQVVIIDLKLDRDDRDYHGLGVISALKQLKPDIKCIVVTAF